jgi:hypothetical protein
VFLLPKLVVTLTYLILTEKSSTSALSALTYRTTLILN